MLPGIDTKIERIEKNELYSSKIYNQLKLLIITGQIKPGTIINEREYSKLLDVSRTPLRDALRLLENEGWIEQVGKNRKIAVLMWKDILELFEIREPLDILCFELAFPKVTAEHIGHLRKSIEEMDIFAVRNANDYYTLMKMDTSFHNYFALITGNSQLIKIQDSISEKVVRSSVLSMKYSMHGGRNFAADHIGILQSVEEGDLEKGKELLHIHYGSWKKRLLVIPERLNFDPQDGDAEIKEEFIKSN